MKYNYGIQMYWKINKSGREKKWCNRKPQEFKKCIFCALEFKIVLNTSTMNRGNIKVNKLKGKRQNSMVQL